MQPDISEIKKDLQDHWVMNKRAMKHRILNYYFNGLRDQQKEDNEIESLSLQHGYISKV